MPIIAYFFKRMSAMCSVLILGKQVQSMSVKKQLLGVMLNDGLKKCDICLANLKSRTLFPVNWFHAAK